MTHPPPLAGGRLTIDLNALVANWLDLDARSRPGRAAAVVKANAYGLGIERVVPTLTAAGCGTFFVALAREGLAVRHVAPCARIFVLNGIQSEEIAACVGANLIPVLSDMRQLLTWRAATNHACAIQVDTGMNRLGFSVAEALELARGDCTDIIHVMSHFACADQPDHALNAAQIELFRTVTTAFGQVESSLSNSAATLWGGCLGLSLTRPGIALCGGESLCDAPNTMRPVITLEGRIIHLREAKFGQSVSYGATQRLDRDTRIATVSIGYADGYPRSASGSGVALRETIQNGAYGFVGGHKAPLLGRVTMDLTMFDVTDIPQEAQQDGWIELIGPNVALDDVARAAGTIGYEILTSLGPRYQRNYHGGTGG